MKIARRFFLDVDTEGNCLVIVRAFRLQGIWSLFEFGLKARLENCQFTGHTSPVIIRKGLFIVLLLAFFVQSVMPARAELVLPPPEHRSGNAGASSLPLAAQNDAGDASASALRMTAEKLIKYFLAALTIPEKDLWVNLSPYEKDRIVPEAFGQTEMGRDLLAQDYLLKQITATLLYPEGETGKQFWKKIYALAQEKYGTTDIPVDTFNKVWIVPEKAVVYENAQAGAVYITDSQLKVMLEQDYQAEELARHPERSEGAPVLMVSQSNNAGDSSLPLAAQNDAGDVAASGLRTTSDIAKNVLREIVIPVLEKEVNEGKNFAPLRQVYQSLILATWYKKKIKKSLLSAVYVDRKKTDGVNISDPKEAEKIWGQYVGAFKKGAYNFVKEERDIFTGDVLPRKFISGGVSWGMIVLHENMDAAMIPTDAYLGKVIRIVMKLRPKRKTSLTREDLLKLSAYGKVFQRRSFAEIEGYHGLDFIKTVKRLLERDNGDFDVLDVGAGVGIALTGMIDEFEKFQNYPVILDEDPYVRRAQINAHGFEVIGMQEVINNKIQVSDGDPLFSRIMWRYGATAEALPVEWTDHFLFVFSTRVIEYVYNPLEFMEECYRVLRNNGEASIVVSLLNDYEYRNRQKFLQTPGVSADESVLGFLHFSGINIFDEIRKLREAGYDIGIYKRYYGRVYDDQLREITRQDESHFFNDEPVNSSFVIRMHKKDSDPGPLKFSCSLVGVSNVMDRTYRLVDGAYEFDSTAERNSPNGGVDFTSDRIDSAVRYSADGIRWDVDSDTLQLLDQAQGFFPIAFSIMPDTDLRHFLGLFARSH